MFEVICSECGKQFGICPSRQKNKINFFCTKECESIYRSKKCITKIKTKCTVCSKILYVKKSQFERRNKNGRITCSLQCLSKIKEKIYKGRLNPNCKYKTLNDNYFENIDSREKAYILGWIASDGHVGKNHVDICINAIDLKTLEKIKDIVCSEINIRPRKNNKVLLKFSSKKISQDVCQWLRISPGKKDKIIRMPQINFGWDFLRGYFEGDVKIY